MELWRVLPTGLPWLYRIVTPRNTRWNHKEKWWKTLANRFFTPLRWTAIKSYVTTSQDTTVVDQANKAKIGSSPCPPALSKLLRKFPALSRVRGRTGRDHTQGGDKIRNTHVEKRLILTRMQTNERRRNPFRILPEINQSVNRFLEEIPVYQGRVQMVPPRYCQCELLKENLFSSLLEQ